MDAQSQKIVVDSLDFIAQNAHMLTGAVLVFLFMIFRKMSWLWYVIPVYVLFFAWKEWYWDEHFEIPEVRGSNLKDFIFYQVGWIGTLILLYFTRKKNGAVV